MALTYQGATLTDDVIDVLLKKAEEYDFLPSFLIVQLYVESLWGNSSVAIMNNNLSGMSMASSEEHLVTVNRPSGVVVTKGSPRPKAEGGYYYRYESLADFIEDWTYLLRPGGIYKVSGQREFECAVKGLFKVGGATYDYAASGYDHYLKAMVSRRKGINQENNDALDHFDEGGSGMSVTANQVLQVARKYLGVTKYSTQHKQLINRYNQVKPLPVGYAVKYADDWCDAFVTAVADEAKASHLIGRECGVERHKNIFKQKGIWHQLTATGNTYQPHPGDIIIFQWNGNRTGWANHIGIVESVKGSSIHTIEGNTFVDGVSKVARRSYHKYATVIQGYACPQYGGATPRKGLSLEAVVKEVLQGKWGNGNERIHRLKQAGYNPDQVQKEVNRKLRPKSFDQVVQEVIAGKLGNGEERVKAIKILGHDPESIQAEVNKRLNNQNQTIKQSPKQPVGGDKPKTGKGIVEVDGVVYDVTLNEK